jgi:hypothetical protein
MRLKKYELLRFLLFLVISLSFFSFGCDKYQSESYEISAVDARACAQIQDTLYNSITAVKLTDFDSTWTHENVPQNVPAIIDSLKVNGIVVSEGDLSTWITTVVLEDTNYVCFQTNLSSVTFYSDQVIGLKIMDTQGEFRNLSNISMPLETVGGCLNEKGNPQIKTRLGYTTPDDEYLLYLINQEQTVADEDDNIIIVLSIQKNN